MRSLIYLLLILTLTGCNSIRSSINYTKGTECLMNDQYSEAVVYLEKAVELDADMGRNHLNLAAAYLQQGECSKAWIAIRNALSCSYPDELTEQAFPYFYTRCVRDQGIDKLGTSEEDIKMKLGAPDIILLAGNQYQYVYGLCIMTFQEGKLIRVGFM
jgi:tetratricopeptide (TPR) repeat protein